MEKRNRYFGLFSGVLFTALMMWSFAYQDEEQAQGYESRNLPQRIVSVDLSKTFSFAGELLPKTMDVKERLDRELLVNSYWQSNTVLLLKRKNRYFPIIENILSDYGVPDDFKYLAVAESGLMNVTSPANAKGFWQFRKLAAKEYGLEVNEEVDERYHLEKSTIAAAKYIRKLYKQFGTWADAAAAYNVGPTNYRKILKTQGETSYFDLNMNEETSRYLFRLLALKEILSQPEDFGFYVNDDELYTPLVDYTEVKIDTTIESWKSFASKYGISYRHLKIYNPWLRDHKLTVKKNTYIIRIPSNINE